MGCMVTPYWPMDYRDEGDKRNKGLPLNLMYARNTIEFYSGVC